MNIKTTSIKDLLVLEPTVHQDERGFFIETYNAKRLERLGIVHDFVQDNHSKSTLKGTVRGLHLQFEPYAQTKLVRCTKGAIFDVAVDLREASPTYLHAFSVVLSEENKTQLLVPKGFAHGFMTLEDDTEVMYKVDAYYDKASDYSLYWKEPRFHITWPELEALLSDKDAKAASYEQYVKDLKRIREGQR